MCIRDRCISNLLLPVAVFVYLVCIDWRMALAMLVTLPFVLIALDVYKRQSRLWP